MNLNKLTIAWKAFIGIINPFSSMAESVGDYVLGILKTALASLSDGTKEKVQAVLNTAHKVLAVLTAIKWLIPTKWQTAYSATIAAVEIVITSLADLEITSDELTGIINGYNEAYRAWMSPDDETCLSLVKIDGVFQAV